MLCSLFWNASGKVKFLQHLKSRILDGAGIAQAAHCVIWIRQQGSAENLGRNCLQGPHTNSTGTAMSRENSAGTVTSREKRQENEHLWELKDTMPLNDEVPAKKRKIGTDGIKEAHTTSNCEPNVKEKLTFRFSVKCGGWSKKWLQPQVFHFLSFFFHLSFAELLTQMFLNNSKNA
jgi:hypothetical protein